LFSLIVGRVKFGQGIVHTKPKTNYPFFMNSKIGTLALSLSVSLSAVAQTTLDSAGAVYNVSNVQLDSEPEFPGGLQALTDFVRNNTIYPDNAFENNIQGIVNVIFTIDTAGLVRNAEVESNVGNGCEEAALAVISKLPTWKPAMLKGKPVPVLYRMPVHFYIPDKLPENDDELYNQEPVYRHTQKEASFPGGRAALIEYLKNQIPEMNTRTAGSAAIVEFVVGMEGKVKKVCLIKSLNDTDDLEYKLDELINQMPAWQPAIANNKKVSSYFRLPINELND
jgi:TonB family protein